AFAAVSGDVYRIAVVDEHVRQPLANRGLVLDDQTRAVRFTESVDRRLIDAVDRLDRLDVADFDYYSDTGIDGVVARSPLARWPVEAMVPGIVGYFELGPDAGFSTPLLPPSDASRQPIDADELAERRELADDLRRILSAPSSAPEPAASRDDDAQLTAGARAVLVPRPELDRQRQPSAPAAEAESVAVFDQLLDEARSGRRQAAAAEPAVAESSATYGKLVDLQLDRSLQQKIELLEPAGDAEPGASSESSTADGAATEAKETAPNRAPERSTLNGFAGDVEAFRFASLDNGYDVLYRNVWIDATRRVQAALLDRTRFLAEAVTAEFRRSELAPVSSLVIGFGEDVVDIVSSADGPRYEASASDLSGSLLHRTRLSPPFESFELLLSVDDLPAGPGAGVLAATLLAFAAIATAGFLLLYRAGLRQIRLARQQRDFVAAVSHELKTPLTSIRMYAEMLRAGWSDEARRKQYYDYIHDESERLTRLIENVLQLSRLSRRSTALEVEPVGIAKLADLLQSKLADRVAEAGFEFDVSRADGLDDARVLVDPDAFLQIAINLVDNALKFSRPDDRKRIECRFETSAGNRLEFHVRDSGPGVPASQTSRIFDLFYRPESTRAREAGGTGIGLAIVRRLAEAMQGSVEVSNRSPGADFVLCLPLVAD
ncbi:MAG: HAMP domain-containing sensor histidine kinase, partial [Woeseiaceae bacterium]|nr:HAMP domain-containing sensor histidine kinase [Woeseiaceae bacterium]